MDYRVFNMETAVTVLSSWVDSKQNRPLLEAIPQTALLLPHLDALYNQLGHIRTVESQLKGTPKAIARERWALNLLFDQKLRGIFDALTAVIGLLSDDDEAKQVRRMRDALFIDGVLTLRHDELAEYNFVLWVEERMTEEMAAILKGITYRGRLLSDDYCEWVNAGMALRDLETRQKRLTAHRDASGICPADIRGARVRWARLAEAVVTAVRLPGITDETSRRYILYPIRAAEIKAGLALKQIIEKSAPSQRVFPSSADIVVCDWMPYRAS
jgi:hypothetical protein